MLLVGVNFASQNILQKYLKKWAALSSVTHIIIVDCYSSKQELERVKEVCSSMDRCSLIPMDNVGYGSALNVGLDKVISLADEFKLNNNELVLFGNIDVFPSSIKTGYLDLNTVPLINILENGRQRNPFLTMFQSRLLWITKLASKYNSSLLLRVWRAIYRVTKLLPSKNSYAVHGALFGLQISQIRLCGPIFDSRVFLYCEELFFARAIQKAGLKFAKSDIYVEHIGSVSTSKTIKKDWRFFFKNWCHSNNIFFEIDDI